MFQAYVGLLLFSFLLISKYRKGGRGGTGAGEGEEGGSLLWCATFTTISLRRDALRAARTFMHLAKCSSISFSTLRADSSLSFT